MVYVYIYIHIHTCINISSVTCIHTYTFVYMHVRVYVYVYTLTYMYECVCVCVSVFVCVFARLYALKQLGFLNDMGCSGFQYQGRTRDFAALRCQFAGPFRVRPNERACSLSFGVYKRVFGRCPFGA